MKRTLTIGWLLAGSAFLCRATGAAPLIDVAPVVLAVEREGITGAGWAVASGAGDSARITLHYPDHPDDFGGSAGTGTALSADGGDTWTAGQDDWPLSGMVDLWQDRLRDGSFVAVGIRWLPDPKRRGEISPAEVPEDAWRIAVSKDGRDWSVANSEIDCPNEYGVIARPLPRFLEGKDGTLHLPAYAWGKSGIRSLLLRSDDGGRHWSVKSVITSAADMFKAGATVTTPWLETTISPTADGSWLAVVRTGSSETSGLMMARSPDEGRTWSPVEKVLAGIERQTVAGKLPGLLLMPNGTLVLLTAHTKRGCFLYLSPDGTGREWSEGQIVTTVTGGNTSMLAIDDDRLLVFTPANRRIHCWRVTIRPSVPNP